MEEIDGELKGRLYPITDQAENVFYDVDGETQITIADPDWDAPTVTNITTGDQVKGSWNRHAYEFTLSPGHDYRVE